MPTQLDSSLIAAANRFPVEDVTAAGNYRTSVQRAMLWTGDTDQQGNINGMQVASFSHTVVAGPPVSEEAVNISLLIFGNDTPAAITARSYYGTPDDAGVSLIPESLFSPSGLAPGVQVPAANYDETINLWFNVTGGVGNILATQAPASAAYQQDVQGTTTTNGVDVSGYAAATGVIGRGLFAELDGGDPTASIPMPFRLGVDYWTDADIADGWAPATLIVPAGILQPTGIILDEALYSQAMRDAGNTFDFEVSPGTTRRFYIVGLYAVPTFP